MSGFGYLVFDTMVCFSVRFGWMDGMNGAGHLEVDVLFTYATIPHSTTMFISCSESSYPQFM
jgi:hypothetical protein